MIYVHHVPKGSADELTVLVGEGRKNTRGTYSDGGTATPCPGVLRPRV